MTLALDTSIIIGIEKREEKVIKILEDLEQLHSEDPKIPLIVSVELTYGTLMKKNRENSRKFIENFEVITMKKTTAQIIANLKAKYAKKGIHFGLGNLCIAAQTIEHGLILVTKDKDFSKFEELKYVLI